MSSLMSDPKHILVVDDDTGTRELFVRRLQHEGYRISEASNGIEALDRVAALSPDLVLLDIQMPGLNGLEVLTRLRQTRTPRDLPIIVATANQDDSMLERALALGANDYVVKPFSSRVLLARVKIRLADRPRQEDTQPHAGTPESPGVLGEGYILDGKYRLGQQIGRGGYGTIFEASHLKLGRKVAIKVVRMEKKTDNDIAAFEHEGIAACKVDHPNAVDIYDVGLTSEGGPYLVMEYLEGQTLRTYAYKKRLSPQRAVDIILPVTFVLAVAHERGIIHHDIKPENIFLDVHHGHEVVKVLDFGLAAFLTDASSKSTEEKVKGSPSYLAPERVAGLASDGRADVYSTGCVLFEMLCGRPPFVREANESVSELASAHILKPPPEVSQFSPEVPEALAQLAALRHHRLLLLDQLLNLPGSAGAGAGAIMHRLPPIERGRMVPIARATTR